MNDLLIASSPTGGPAAAVRAALDRYLAAWERAAGGGPVPSPADALADLPAPDRPRLRPAVDALAAWARAAFAVGDRDGTLAAPPEPGSPLPGTGEAGADSTPPSDSRFATPPPPGAAPAEWSGPVAAGSTALPDPTPDGVVRSTEPHIPGAARGRRVDQIPGYEVHGELGHGGMGVVYVARHTRLDRLVAIKLMLHADEAGSAARERFDAEARAVARMQHPNIVQVFEVGEAAGVPFFSLEYVPGGTLSRKVAQQLLAPREAASLVATLARAVQYAHDRGVVHRDLKPGNILIGEDGTPKIADFGLAKRLEHDSGLTHTGAIVGTPSYMPPEQASGELEKVGPPADVYSLGAILYDLLAGRPPFKGANVLDTLEQVRTREPVTPGSLQPGVPRDLETICLKCLEKDPAKRYASAAALADDLQRYLKGEPILARPVGPAERAWRWCKRNPRLASLFGAVFSLLLLIAGGSATAAGVYRYQRNEIAAKHQAAEERYTLAQRVVHVLVTDAPGALEGQPLAGLPLEDLLTLGVKALEDVQGKTDDRGLADRGRLSVLIRRGMLAHAQGNLDEAGRLFEEARALADQLARPGSPERDKAVGNLALVYNRQAAVCQSRAEAVARTDRAAGRRQLAEAARLNREALALQQRVLEAPETGEIPPGEARTWLASTHLALAVTHRLQAQAGDADPALTAAGLDHARRAEAHARVGLDSGELAPRVRERTQLKLALAALESARAADRLGRLDDAEAAFKRAAGGLTGLVKAQPRNLQYRQNLAQVSSEYGDFLLLRRNDPKRAKDAYTPAVINLRPVAQPPELAGLVNVLALNYYKLATAHLKAGNKADAVRVYGLCLEIRQAQLREAERSPEAKNPAALAKPKIALMLALARCGKHQEAAAIADEIASTFKADPQRVTHAAAGYALCSAAAEGDRKAEYMDRAIATLSRAVDGGFADLEFLERDPDLDPAREDERFRPILERARERQGKK